MVKSMNASVMVLLALAMATTSLMLDRAEAAEYIVGDDLGWTIPPDGAATYASWASKHTLEFVPLSLVVSFAPAVGCS
ncbi:hypothetical protein ACE6H2_014785 [Prunus campanulata]